MTDKQFEYKCKNYHGVPITDNYTLWIYKKSVVIADDRTEDSGVRFASIAEALEFVIDDGWKIKDIIETWTDMPEQPLDADIIWHTKKEGKINA